MSEKEVPVEVIGLAYFCDECGQQMRPNTGTVLLSSPPQYPHACPNGHKRNLKRSYPAVDYRLKEQGES